MSSLSATDWLNTISETDLTSRDNAIIKAIADDNIPIFLKNRIEVLIADENNKLFYWVSPDVLSIGTNDDFVRVPMGGKTAKKIVDELNCVISTPKMVFDIWQQSEIKAIPIMGSPPFDNSMGYTSKFVNHNVKIQNELDNLINYRLGKLTSGIKKDIVVCSQLWGTANKNLAIFGWYNTNGIPVQPLNATSHSIDYQDYSSSLRLVNRYMSLNGQKVDYYDVLNDPKFSYLLTNEGICFDASEIYL